MSNGRDAWDSSSYETKDLPNSTVFSEHELLDIMYNACDVNNTGDVLVSSIVQYMRTMTVQCPDMERLSALELLLDPGSVDPAVSREVFHSKMREWISQCSQDSCDVDSSLVSWPDSTKNLVNGLDFSSCQSKSVSSETHPCSCTNCSDGKDLVRTVAELKQAHRKLSEHNNSLLRTVAQCEDVNLQLTLEVTDLRGKLTSAQRSAVRTRSLTQELEELRQTFKEAQERASRSQSSCTKLNKEIECLKMHIRRLEDKNEKLMFERTCSEDGINKLMKINSELRAELEETLVMLTVRDKEVTKKDIIMDKMKNSHVENHSIIESLQSEMMRLHENSQQVLLRYDRHCISSHSLYNREPPNHRSLKSEIQDTQQHHHKTLDDISIPALHSEDIQNILHKIKNAEISQVLQNKYPARDSAPVEMQEERPLAPRCQQQTSIKQQLVNVLQELELQKWEEKGEKVEEHSRARDKEAKQSHPENQTTVRQAKKVAVVNWWKAVSGEKAQKGTNGVASNQDLSDTQEKLRAAEQTITDMREQVCLLQASLRSAQDLLNEQKHCSLVLSADKATNTEPEKELLESIGKEQRDVAVETDPVEVTGASSSPQDSFQLTADQVLVTLKKMEDMVNRALDTAEQVKEGEQRVSRVRQRMESITQKVKKALGRTVSTERQMDRLQLDLSANPAQIALEDTSGPSSSADASGDDENCRLPVISAIPDLKENGDAGRSERGSTPKEEKTHLWQGSQVKCSDSSVFIFPHTRSRPPLLPNMPTLPEEEEDSPEEMDSSSSSPSTSTPGDGLQTPTIIFPKQATVVVQSDRALDQTRPHSPRARVSRTSFSGPITTVDSSGNVIDLVKDALPEMRLSEEERKKNLELLEQAKKASDRFLTRRGRRSTSSLTDSPTRLSPSTTPTSLSSPCSSRSNSLTVAPHTSFSPVDLTQASPVFSPHLEVPSPRDPPSATHDNEALRPLLDWKPAEKRKVSSGSLTPRFALPKENCDQPKSHQMVPKSDGETSPGRNLNQTPATGVAKPVPRPPTQQAPCTAEIKTIGAFPPLMRAVTWDSVGSLKPMNGAPSFPPMPEDTFSVSDAAVNKSSGYKDILLQPVGIQKLSKLREEHKLMRNQSISKLPELSESSEQEKGGPPVSPAVNGGDESKEKSDVLPHISDVMLRKLKLHRGLPGCAPPLTEKEVENAFVQLSLAYRNDNYTLEMRLKQAERERNLTEEDTEKELEEFKNSLKITSPQWQNMEQRDAYQRLIETVSVLHRLATRLSSRAEIVGAVRQEKRLNKATEVMMQYVENLKRTYEKDHAELMEYKKLANQNSNRCYGSSADTGDDGVPRSSRSMSVTLGKALPRRRVSVAVVPKFSSLNIPGQNPSTAGPGPSVGPSAGATLPVLCEANDPKVIHVPTETPQAAESGKSASDQEGETDKPSVNVEELRAEIRAELKAKIEEEAYNKGLQEGLKQIKTQEEAVEEESVSDILPLEVNHKDEESGKKITPNRSMEEIFVCLGRFCPRVSWSKRLLLIVLMIVLLMCLVISIFSFFKNYYNRRDDT